MVAPCRPRKRIMWENMKIMDGSLSTYLTVFLLLHVGAYYRLIYVLVSTERFTGGYRPAH